MINNYVYELLKQNNVNDAISFENVMRESVQKIILYALSRTTFFKKAAFYGGTCLRIFHNLQRFSEDLDFCVINDDEDFSWNDYMDTCINVLESYGLQAIISSKPGYDEGEIRRRYINIPCAELAREYFGKNMFHKDRNISIKMEISTAFTKGAHYSTEILTSPMLTSVVCYDMPTLFAGKLGAVLNRAWKNRIKGRDFYDYVFYMSLGVKYNAEYLNGKFAESTGIDLKDVTDELIKEKLRERFENADYDLVMADIKPFVLENNTINAITKDMLLATVNIISHE